MKKEETLFIVTGTTKGLGHDIFIDLLSQKQNIFTINRSPFDYKENIIFDFSEIDKVEVTLIPILKEKIKDYKMVVMILNAGVIDPIKEIGNYESSSVIKIVNTNFISPILLTNFLVKEKKEGIIVNMSSGVINFDFEGLGLYTSSKIATHKFFDIANIEDTRMSFINYDPGSMNTQMTKKLRDEENHFQEESRKYLWKKLEEDTYKISKDSAKKLLVMIYETLDSKKKLDLL